MTVCPFYHERGYGLNIDPQSYSNQQRPCSLTPLTDTHLTGSGYRLHSGTMICHCTRPQILKKAIPWRKRMATNKTFVPRNHYYPLRNSSLGWFQWSRHIWKTNSHRQAFITKFHAVRKKIDQRLIIRNLLILIAMILRLIGLYSNIRNVFICVTTRTEPQKVNRMIHVFYINGSGYCIVNFMSIEKYDLFTLIWDKLDRFTELTRKELNRME